MGGAGKTVIVERRRLHEFLVFVTAFLCLVAGVRTCVHAQEKPDSPERRPARSLRDLMRIRSYPPNRDYLNSINGRMGTALGLKRSSGQQITVEPAIIVFVPRKVHVNWIEDGQDIKRELGIPDPPLYCPIDVVQAGTSASLQTLTSLSPENEALVDRLRGVQPHLVPGSRLAVLDSQTPGELMFQVGAFARTRDAGEIGFLTHQLNGGDRLAFHPKHATGTAVGFSVNKRIGKVSAEEWYGDPHVGKDVSVTVDAEFYHLHPGLDLGRINPLVPELGKLGPVERIDLDADMTDPSHSIIGRRVVHVGPQTGFSRGSIGYFGYEYSSRAGETHLTDFLIVGDRTTDDLGSMSPLPFSARGESGGLIIAEEGLRPIGLVWGGKEFEMATSMTHMTYGSRLDRVLDHLDIDLVSSTPENIARSQESTVLVAALTKSIDELQKRIAELESGGEPNAPDNERETLVESAVLVSETPVGLEDFVSMMRKLEGVLAALEKEPKSTSLPHAEDVGPTWWPLWVGLAALVFAIGALFSHRVPADAKREIPPIQPAADDKPIEETMPKRFNVALSFPGEHRTTVEGIAKSLSRSLAREKVFYDRFWEPELARPNLDTHLQNIYQNDSDLVVVFLCAAYDEKEWCGLEFRAIRNLMKKRRDDEIMFIRVDDGDVKGVFEIDGYLDAKGRSASDIAKAIRDRLKAIQGQNPP